MATTINTINVGGISKEVEDSVARSRSTYAAEKVDSLDANVVGLQTQIDQIIAPTGEAPNPAEVTDARIGADRITYDSLGKAIRTQFDNLKSSDRYGYEKIEVTVNGSFSRAGGPNTGQANRIRPELISFSSGDEIIIKNGSFRHACGMWQGVVDNDHCTRNDNGWTTTDETIRPDYDGFLCVTFSNASDGNISPSSFDGDIRLYEPFLKGLKDAAMITDACNDLIRNDVVWERGTLNNGRNQIDSSNMRSRDIIHVKAGSTIIKNTTESAISVAYFRCNDLSTYIGGEQILGKTTKGTYVFNSDCYVRILWQNPEGLPFDHLNNYVFNLFRASLIEPCVKIGVFGYSEYLGNAISIQFDDSSTMLIDSFCVDAWIKLYYDLVNRGIRHIDRFMLTHWHDDHAGCIPKLIENGFIDNNTIVYLPPDLDKTATGNLPWEWSIVTTRMEEMEALIVGAGCTIIHPTEGQVVPIAGCYLKFWNCDHSVYYPNGAYPSTNYNDWSMCAYLFVGEKNMCFNADLGPIGQQRMVDLGTMIKANLYTATHHGWDNGNATNYFGLIPAWINRLQPDVVFSEDSSVHDEYILTKQSPTQTWCEKNHVPNYRTRINGSMDVLLKSSGWTLLGEYSNYIRGDINWFFDYRDYMVDTKIDILSKELLTPKYTATSTDNLLRQAIVAMLGSDFNTPEYRFDFRVRVLDSGNDSAYLEYTVEDFVPESSSGNYYAGTRTRVLYWSAYNTNGTVAITGLTGTPRIIVELIEYSSN